jgi:hypothetical protein
LPFAEYKRRQNQHREAEIRALLDVPEFIGKARDIYQYPHFVCDSGGSLCEIVDPSSPLDPVLTTLAEHTLLLYIEGTPEHTRMLVERFKKQPKPMYYQPAFLDAKWAEYKALNKIADDDGVDPDGFAIWGFEQLLLHRIPLYREIARNFGYTFRMQDIPGIQSESDFVDLLSIVLDRKN